MKRRRVFGAMLMLVGALIVTLAIGSIPAQAEPTAFQAVPSPRPALPPVDEDEPTAEPEAGHITGTVIEQTSGAPASGINVNVGGVIVSSDANGNYDRWVSPGVYTVTLSLRPEQGEALQGPKQVEVAPAGRTVQHLAFRALQATAVPTSAPGATAAPVPTATMTMPTRLPRTANADAGNVLLWIPMGLLLLMLGGLVSFAPPRSRVALTSEQLLARLLDTPPGAGK
ncbi:MAG TPA: hypothetical protein VFS21_09365 [Roseiflexaceae bacterium]|nr:hypothetical protein [Roseiflexaceae bacterium]